MLREKHASALLSTGVFGVRGTPGHPSTKPAMYGVGAELGLVFAQPGFQHRQHSSTNGLTRQHEQNATKEEKMTRAGISLYPSVVVTTILQTGTNVQAELTLEAGTARVRY